MSYSISFSCKTKNDQKTLLNYLNKNYKPWSEVFPNSKFPDAITSESWTSDLGYSNEKENQIGVNYSFLNVGERQYVFGILMTLASIYGKKQRVQEVGPIELHTKHPVPVVLYDGEPEFPVLETKDVTKVTPENSQFIFNSKIKFHEFNTKIELEPQSLIRFIGNKINLGSLTKANDKVRDSIEHIVKGIEKDNLNISDLI